MLDRQALEYLVNLNETKVLTLADRQYTTKPIHALVEPTPATVGIHTLTGIIDYLKTNPDGLEESELFVHVAGHDRVDIRSNIQGDFQQRHNYLSAALSANTFRFSQYYEHEDFIIAMQSLFVPDDTTAAILKLVGNLKDENVTTFSDDGITQQVSAKTGIARVEDVPVPNPVELQPYRTFLEVEQPKSKFIFRMKSGSPLPRCALFEADGGRWKHEAISAIRGYLKAEVPEITIIA